MTSKPSKRYFGVYRKIFRLQVHLLIAWGHHTARRRIKSTNEEEPTITGYITEAIKAQLRTSYPPWCIYYSVTEDTPIEAIGRTGMSRPRPDIIIEFTKGSRPEYIFEAKRLRNKGYRVDRYIDSDGMGCFISGSYASRYDEAAMIGYVQSNLLVHWQRAIRKAIDDNAEQLHLKPPQIDEMVIDILPLEWASEHERYTVGSPIRIYHILLDCIV